MSLLRRPNHPEFSDLLVHLTGRSGRYAWLPPAIYALSATQRLESILWNRTILCRGTFGAPSPVVCFSEATNAGLNHLIGTLGYQPWGIVFPCQLVYDREGGPVFHYRPDEWDAHLAALPDRLRARFIRFEAGKSEWLWEREWRVVFEQGAPGFEFGLEDVVALIVGDPDWPPLEPDPAYAILGEDIAAQVLVRPVWLPNCERWWWNPRRGALEVIV